MPVEETCTSYLNVHEKSRTMITILQASNSFTTCYISHTKKGETQNIFLTVSMVNLFCSGFKDETEWFVKINEKAWVMVGKHFIF